MKKEIPMPKVTGLGHVGLYVRELEVMKEFYSDFLGLTVTDRDERRVFLSARPGEEHHEVLLAKNDEHHTDPQQLSFPVETLADLREFYAQIVERNYHIDHVNNHGNAFGCYFHDPEGNRVEVYWHTGLDWPQPYGVPVDLFLSEEDLMIILEKMKASL
jgi:catechol-2,3-dioxygenase